MKTILMAWLVVFSLYLLTPYAIATEGAPSNVMPVWGAYGVVGDLCVDIVHKSSGKPGKVELWLVNSDRVQWFPDAQGTFCLAVEFSSKSELYAVVYEEPIDISVVEDNTTSNFTVDLPI